MPPPSENLPRGELVNSTKYLIPEASHAYGGVGAAASLPNTLKGTSSKSNMISQVERSTRSLLTLNARNILPTRNEEVLSRPSEPREPAREDFKFRFQNTQL